MGTTPKPLKILVHQTLAEAPEILALQAQGHEVCTLTGLDEIDLVLGPNAWHMNGKLLKYLPMALRSARTTRYGGFYEPGEDTKAPSRKADSTAPDGHRKRASTGAKRSIRTRRASSTPSDSGGGIPTEV